VSGKYPYWPDYTDDEGDALREWFDDVCGDCVDGDHHGADEADCGCARHTASVEARGYYGETTKATALAWRDAKRRGEVVVDHA
jgi:hypothetical protein